MSNNLVWVVVDRLLLLMSNNLVWVNVDSLFSPNEQ